MAGPSPIFSPRAGSPSQAPTPRVSAGSQGGLVIRNQRGKVDPLDIAMVMARRELLARYDAAGNQAELRNHWKAADALSADAALTPGVRDILRRRSRYETANSPQLKGIADQVAQDMVGTGPRPHVVVEAGRELEARVVRDAWVAWSRSVNLTEKLRIMRRARVDSGEAFAVMVNNDPADRPVQLDLTLYEADQCAFPPGAAYGTTDVDGIRYDDFGNPVAYSFLESHPGAISLKGLSAREEAARNVLHYYRADRPGQSRGMPDITPALPLFAIMRRFTLATTLAAETAANFAGVLRTNASSVTRDDDGNEIEQPGLIDMEEVELARNAFTALPAGADLVQFKAEHPNSTHKEFQREMLRQAARCMQMPLILAGLDSSESNFSAARLDCLTYWRYQRGERCHMVATVLDPLFRAWWREAILVDGLLPQRFRLRSTPMPRVEWRWDKVEDINPESAANATETELSNHVTTRREVFAERGLDWMEEVDQIAFEKKYMAEKGVTEEDLAAQTARQQAKPKNGAAAPAA